MSCGWRLQSLVGAGRGAERHGGLTLTLLHPAQMQTVLAWPARQRESYIIVLAPPAFHCACFLCNDLPLLTSACLPSWPPTVLANCCRITPPASLPHALSAGHIPTYGALRSLPRYRTHAALGSTASSSSAGSRVMVGSVATRLLRSLLVLVAPGSKLLLLLGEGHRREAGALATTLCKAHLQHAQLAAGLGSREGLQQAAGMATGLARVVRADMTAEAREAPAVPTATSRSSHSSSSSGGDSGSPQSLPSADDASTRPPRAAISISGCWFCRTCSAACCS